MWGRLPGYKGHPENTGYHISGVKSARMLSPNRRLRFPPEKYTSVRPTQRKLPDVGRGNPVRTVTYPTLFSLSLVAHVKHKKRSNGDNFHALHGHLIAKFSTGTPCWTTVKLRHQINSQFPSEVVLIEPHKVQFERPKTLKIRLF
jgi:hypothetical protein